MHLKEGAISLENISDKVPADASSRRWKKSRLRSTAVNSIRLQVQSRPMKEKMQLKAGETLPDDKLVTMNYYVDGVVGKVPN